MTHSRGFSRGGKNCLAARDLHDFRGWKAAPRVYASFYISRRFVRARGEILRYSLWASDGPRAALFL